jgi:hypothetical protein
MNTIGIIGSGIVARTLTKGCLQKGHPTKIGSRSPDKLNKWLSEDGKGAEVGSFDDAAAFGDVLILAVKGSAAENALNLIDKKNLAGKTIIDTTNPIADTPPENGVLHFFTDLEHSLMEKLQEKHPEANFVKAFNSVGSAFMVDPSFSEKPTMFICGNNDHAKAQSRILIENLGWEVEDMGSVEAARAIEPLCMLWCIPGFRENRWTHAFKLVKS